MQETLVFERSNDGRGGGGRSTASAEFGKPFFKHFHLKPKKKVTLHMASFEGGSTPTETLQKLVQGRKPRAKLARSLDRAIYCSQPGKTSLKEVIAEIFLIFFHFFLRCAGKRNLENLDEFPWNRFEKTKTGTSVLETHFSGAKVAVRV